MISILVAAFAVGAVPADTARFAQGVEYRIEARLDEVTDLLHGRAELRYTNHSAVPLDTLWFHQHLNAFRPESRWARRELEFANRRFQDLGPEQHAFERILASAIDGRPVSPVYPLAPDSTVVGLPLAEPLRPGATTVVLIDWTARLSTTPRRQGRRDRHYDFAQWYPRIAVFNLDGWQVQPLLPQGEFFGEFGSYDVTLEVAADQVIGATGVAITGDPGWSARSRGGFDEAMYQRDHYAPLPGEGLGLLAPAIPPGQKRVRWRADDVHHFAWSANPEFLYEGGTLARTGPGGGDIAIHVLYLPSDADWGNGVVLRRTTNALRWLQDLFGPYPWPQLTNLHRIESGGTEFPMLMMNGSPSEGLIVHETTHQYLHGILANNEFAEGWLDEGFTSFIENWYFEEHGVASPWDESLRIVRSYEAAGRTQPIAWPGEAFESPSMYSAMTYTKTELVLRMLRWLIGEDTMRQALRTYYDRYALRHVYEPDFRAAVADAAGEDLGWFFDQWFHTTAQLDYRIATSDVERLDDGRWRTRLEVTRAGDAWMPVDLRVGDEVRRLTSRDPRQVVEFITASRPAEAVLDPDNVLIDRDPSNNRVRLAD